jgi:Carboxypeptidase regulatory-like domain
MEIRPGQHVDGVMLTFTDRPSELTGLVQDASGQPATDYSIIVFAADRRFWTTQSRRIKSARPDHDGKYTLRNLPAGEYLLVAAIDVEQDEWFDPSFLQRIAPAAIRVAISDGEKKVQDLRIAAGR